MPTLTAPRPRVRFAGHLFRRTGIRLAPRTQLREGDDVNGFRGDFDGDIAEAQIIVENFLFTYAFQPQSGGFKHAGSLNGDGMAHTARIIEAHQTFTDRHNR